MSAKIVFFGVVIIVHNKKPKKRENHKKTKPKPKTTKTNQNQPKSSKIIPKTSIGVKFLRNFRNTVRTRLGRVLSFKRKKEKEGEKEKKEEKREGEEREKEKGFILFYFILFFYYYFIIIFFFFFVVERERMELTGPVTCAGERSLTMEITEKIEENVYPLLPEMFQESPLVLQPLWDFILEEGSPFVNHWLFAGWLTFFTYMLICFYFTWKGFFCFFFSFFFFVFFFFSFFLFLVF